MLHPSYTELMKVVNSAVEEGETPVINSRYSIVMATAKRARQIIAGDAVVTPQEKSKPLSTAVAELNAGKIKILAETEEPEDEMPKIPVTDTIELMMEDSEETEETEEAEETEA